VPSHIFSLFRDQSRDHTNPCDCDVRRRTNSAASLQRDLVMDMSGVALNQTVRSHLKLVRQQDFQALLEDEHVQSLIDGVLVRVNKSGRDYKYRRRTVE
jgi:hypothetical protein